MLYERLEPHSENLPDIFVKVLEMRAGAHRLYRWSRPENKDHKSKIITIGNDFIRSYCAKEQLDTPENLSKFEELKDHWITGMSR